MNGSGHISVSEVDDYKGKINGSGHLICDKIGNARVSISGSGTFQTNEVFGSLTVGISGSGHIDAGKGDIETFNASISGYSGHIKAQEITCRKADLTISGSGNITIGRVIKESNERHSKQSKITVLQRG